VEQGLPRFLVIERRMEKIWSKPSLHAQWINNECLEFRILFNLRA
jgi:hypothetical protein